MAKLFLWGGRLQARLIEHMARQAGYEVRSIFDPGLKTSTFETSASFLNTPESVPAAIHECSHFVVCIGNNNGLARAMISDFCEAELRLSPLSLVHPTAYISEAADIGKGLQVMPNATIHHFATVGDWSIINTNGIVEHENQIGRGVHIMPGATLAGLVKVRDYATIGTNATILPDLTIGSGAYVGAGAVVTHDVSENQVVVGVPAKPARVLRQEFDAETLDKIRAVIS